MEARDVIERRSLNILYLYRPGRERDESGRKEGKKEKQKGEQTKQTKKNPTASTQVSVTLVDRSTSHMLE